MAKLPWPPAALPRLRSSDTQPLKQGSLLWRVYRAGGVHGTTWDAFRHFGPVAVGRFDHHEPPPRDHPDRGILYAGQDVIGVLAEAFQDTRTIDRHRDQPWLVGFELARDVLTLDLTGLWPTRAGASQAIATGRRNTARAWSRLIYSSYGRVEGLRYASAMAGGSVNVSLYERAGGSLPASPRAHVPLTHPGLLLPLQRAAAQLGYGLV